MSDMSKRYNSIDELLAVARRENLVIRSNSLAGVFKWTPDQFEHERSAGRFLWDACNFWLQPATECIAQMEEDIIDKRREADNDKLAMAPFLEYATRRSAS